VCRPEEPTEVATLTLLRTPKYEPILGEWERGVSVSFEAGTKFGGEIVLLREVKYGAADKVVTVRSEGVKSNVSSSSEDEFRLQHQTRRGVARRGETADKEERPGDSGHRTALPQDI
jgi:hypothetical protein